MVTLKLQRELGGLRAYSRHREAHNLPGKTLQAVQDAIASNRIVRDADGQIDFQMADMMWAANTDKIQQTRAHHGMTPTGRAIGDNAVAVVSVEQSWAAARARREVAQAELAELELQKQLGEVVAIEPVLDALTDANIKARTSLLQIPDRLSGQLAAESDAAKVHDLLRAEIENVVREIENGVRQLGEMSVAVAA